MQNLNLTEDRLNRIEESLNEVQKGQEKILGAILGNIDEKTPGLIEQTRSLRQDVNNLSQQTLSHAAQIQECLAFKSVTRKMLAGVAVIVPLLFGGLKLLFFGVVEFFKVKN
jgi:hypothetical protein